MVQDIEENLQRVLTMEGLLMVSHIAKNVLKHAGEFPFTITERIGQNQLPRTLPLFLLTMAFLSTVHQELQSQSYHHPE